MTDTLGRQKETCLLRCIPTSMKKQTLNLILFTQFSRIKQLQTKENKGCGVAPLGRHELLTRPPACCCRFIPLGPTSAESTQSQDGVREDAGQGPIPPAPWG